MTNWIILLLVLSLTIYFTCSGIKRIQEPIVKRSQFYTKDILFNFLLLAVFFFVKPALYEPLDFTEIGRGLLIDWDLLSAVIPIFAVPFVFSFFPKYPNYPKDIHTAKELLGCPVQLLPGTAKEYCLFLAYILAGVVFEELLCRQFLFYTLHYTVQLRGDAIMLLSSFLFAIGHLYQGWKGVASAFVTGLLLGKVFQVTGTLLYPIVLHTLGNLTVAVLAFRRIRDLKNLAVLEQVRNIQ